MTNMMTSGTWLVVAGGVVLARFVAWRIFVGSRRTRIERSGESPGDGLPARRNQALIDAPSPHAEVELPPPAPPGLAGAGEAVAAAAQPAHQTVPADDLKKIKGIGPKVEALLNSLGVTSYSQIAAWDEDEIERIDARLGAFSGRIRRDD